MNGLRFFSRSFGAACGKFLSGAKVLAALPSISQPRRIYRELHDYEIDLKLTGSSCQQGLKYRVLEECFFSRMVNRNFILFYFCTIDRLVHVLTLFRLLRLIHMTGEIEPRPVGSPLVIHKCTAS